MLYLIGGPPRCGKTTLAEVLAKEKSIPYFPIDHVTSVVTPYIPESERESAFPLSAARVETSYSNDIFYAKYSPQQIVGFYLHQADTYWPGVENFIKYALADEHDLILEGWQILPSFIHAVSTPENQAKLKVVFLYKLDRAAIVAGLKANKAKVDWVIRNTNNEGTYRAIAEMISHFGSYIEAEAKKYKLEAVNTDFAFKRKLADSLKILL
jgi:2-phosphoglycerate kinase